MNPQVPFYLTLILFLIAAILLYFILYTVNFGLQKLGYALPKRRNIILVIASALSIWLISTAILAYSGYFLDFQSTPPKILVILIPAALAVTYTSNSEWVIKLIEVIPKSWLIYIQSFRILMEIFLFLMLLKNIIPIQMTFEGKNFDILIGISAAPIAYYCSIKKFPKIIALLWNIAGILLVTNVFLIAILSSPGPLRKFFTEPPNTIIAYFPFIWIPAIIVPFAYLAHILSIKQILRSKDEN